MPNLETTQIDITKVPFSRYGSFLAIHHDAAAKKLTVHNARHLFGEDHILDIEFENDGGLIDFETRAVPEMAEVHTPDGVMRFYLVGKERLIIQGVCPGMLLKIVNGKVSWGYQNELYPTVYGVQENDRVFRIIRVDSRLNIYVQVEQGTAMLEGPMELSPNGGQRDSKSWLGIAPVDGEISLILDITAEDNGYLSPNLNGAKELEKTRLDWEKWYKTMPSVPADHRLIAERTWYNLWSSVVKAEDTYRYDAMLMSKKYMCSVWSWDHCFNALSVAKSNLKMGLEQFLLPFEVQAESGVLPDYFNPNSETVWGVTKPPIHGWAFSLLMDQHEIDTDTLIKVYDHLEKWTNWWFEYRDSDHDGIPEYPQGCDGGGDNYTLFDNGFFIEAPDLSAYLILQMRTLSQIAARLNDVEHEEYWRQRYEEMLENLYDHSWTGDRFVAKFSRSHEVIDNTTCLALLLPIVLGDLLDSDKMAKLVRVLENDFLTKNGPATESLNSPLYERDGYWRGPIWAPTTYLLVDGLRRGGYRELATKIARGFCEMIRDMAGGNYENFDAITGEGLRAPGYTWTASVHLLLLNEFLLEDVEI